MMSAEEELCAGHTQGSERTRSDAPTISPTRIATHVMCEIRFKPALHHLDTRAVTSRSGSSRGRRYASGTTRRSASTSNCPAVSADFFRTRCNHDTRARRNRGEELVYVLRHLPRPSRTLTERGAACGGHGEALLKHADALRARHGQRDQAA